MSRPTRLLAAFGLVLLMCGLAYTVQSQDPPAKTDAKVRDAAEDATRSVKVAGDRPEVRQTDHDKSDAFKKSVPINPMPTAPASTLASLVATPVSTTRTPVSTTRAASVGVTTAGPVSRSG